MTLEKALVSVWRQSLLEQADAVELDGRTYRVKRTSRRGLRQVDFQFSGEAWRGLEQNPQTQSRWAQLAREGKRVMQFLNAGRYVAVVVEGRAIFYSKSR